MPKYQNTTNKNITLEGQIVHPFSTFETQVIYDPLPAGILKLSDDPSYNPMVVSTFYNADTVIPVPVGLHSYIIDLWVESGRWEVRFNTPTMTPPLYLCDGTSWSRRFHNRLVGSIILTRITPGGSIWLQLERS